MTAEPLRVLLVEDNPADARMVQELLREWGPAPLVLTHALRLRQAVDYLQHEGFHAVLLDLGLPDSEGIATFARAHAEAPSAPIVVLTGLHDEEMAVKAVGEGAQDYLVKGEVDGPALYQSIRYAIERQRVEDRLRESEQRYRSLFDGVTVGLYRSAVDGRFLEANAALVRILGLPDREVLLATRATTLYADPEDRRRWQTVMERDGEVRAYEFRYRRPDGTVATLTDTAKAVRGPDGNVMHYEGAIEDVTELWRTQQQLLQAQKMEAVGRLAGGVAHDFNNCLTAIFGYLELVAEDLHTDSPAQADLGEIRKATQRAAGLTRQLLAFSRQQVLQPIVLNMNDVIEDVQKMLGRLIGEDIALRASLAPDSGNVRADPGQLEQVILNLAVNARDAMPTGGKLTIETMNAELSEQYAEFHQPVVPGRYVMLAVSDTGVGMTPEVRAKVFEPFFTTKELGKGTGLGLSTVYGIVKQSGGYVWAYSELGQGSTFKVYLPRVDAPVEVTHRAPEPEGTPAGTETILLAEDDDLLRPLARSLLEKVGYTVLAAANAEEALALASKHPGPIALLVADVVMPGESGRQLGRRLAPLRPETRVLYVSGYTDDAIVHHGLLEPGLNYLQKPFTPAALARKVREVLDAQPR